MSCILFCAAAQWEVILAGIKRIVEPLLLLHRHYQMKSGIGKTNGLFSKTHSNKKVPRWMRHGSSSVEKKGGVAFEAAVAYRAGDAFTTNLFWPPCLYF